MPDTNTTPTADTITALTDTGELRVLRTAATARLAALLADQHGTTPAPGRRARIDSSVSPLVLANLTGTIEDEPSSKPGFCYLLLDESSTEALRRDHRAGRRRPAAATKRQRLHIPTDCLMLADHDS
ncbi:hypothetical protein ABZ864_47610 [Streptomyces sp. NPDC047082]|uniref:hypothetical protein n=1 Tax=Streptomyces sp. NPDC047082 TaxID=3155259 RepID=UPI0033DD3A94